MWREFYETNPGSTTWRITEPTLIPRSALGVTTVAVGLLLSSPQTSEIADQLSRLPQSSSTNRDYDFTIRHAVQPLPSTGEQLAAIQSTFALNKSQLATACGVKRQTIYDWYAGNFQAEGGNADRLATLYRLVMTIRQSGLKPLPSKAAERRLPDGASLLDLLSQEDMNSQRLVAAVGLLQSPAASGESAREQRKRLGWQPLTEEQRDANLQSNLDSFLDG